MSQQSPSRKLTRRDFLKLGAGALAAAAGAKFVPVALNRPSVSRATAQAAGRHIRLAATDGWINLPGQVVIPGSDPLDPKFYSPDPWAPEGRTTYVFGFRNVTGWSEIDILAQKGLAQHTAPILWADEGEEVYLTLTNLGFVMRPDLIDAHSVHWHGFRKAIPYFDGVPQTGVSVPLGRDFTYYYKPRDPGTYMYHCHVEEVEHIQMGMVGIIFVRPAQNQAANAAALYPSGKFAYNDGDGSTGYDREFVIVLTEIWAEMHWDDAHIQLPEWTDYRADFYTINGRVYPDTLLDNRPNFDPGPSDLGAADRLQYQPISALVKAQPGERVLLRFVNLGYGSQTMTTDNIKMTVVGKDATYLRGLDINGVRGPDGADLSYMTNSIHIAPGETVDAIFTAPAEGTYLLYNRNYNNLDNPGDPDNRYGGQMTEIRISTGLPAQTEPNT